MFMGLANIFKFYWCTRALAVDESDWMVDEYSVKPLKA